MTTFEPTHYVSADGLTTWQTPDVATAAGPSLPLDLGVRVIQQWGDWSQVECSNGWVAWVDGRHLRGAAGAVTPAAPAAYAPALDLSPVHIGAVRLSVPIVGAALAAASAFLPWASLGAVSTSAMDLPASFLADYQTTDTGGIKIGWVLIALSGAVLALCLNTGAGPRRAARALGFVLVLLPTVYVAQLQRSIGALQTGSVFSATGFGVYVALGAGLLIAMAKPPEQASVK
jgi:hypothetical protein